MWKMRDLPSFGPEDVPTGPVVPVEDFAVVDDEQGLADADAAGHQEGEEDVENEGVLTVVTVENQAVSTDQDKEAKQEEPKEEVKGEDQSADVIQPNQKEENMMDAQGKLMKRVDSENQAERFEKAESFCMDLMESGRNVEGNSAKEMLDEETSLL